MKFSRKMVAATVAVAASFAVWSTVAVAAPPETTTVHNKGVVETFVDAFPSCEDGAPYEVTTVTNSVEHTTVFADGREHGTFTQTGTFEATPLEDPSLPDASGRLTIWGGFNANGKTVNGTFTLSIRGLTEDGERINFHTMEHFNQRPDGTVNEFFRCSD